MLIEGFRPGRDGAARRSAPTTSLARNPKLVYGRMTGYGQDGPMAAVAGHDINYISLSGALGAIAARRARSRSLPLNLVGDFGGGAMMLALRRPRRGDRGASSRATARSSTRRWSRALGPDDDADPRDAGRRHVGRSPGKNLLDSGAHFYEIYECADGGYIADRRARAAVLRGAAAS